MANILLKPVELLRRSVTMFWRTFVLFTEELGRIMLFLCSAIKQLVLPPFELKNTFKQVVEIGD